MAGDPQGTSDRALLLVLIALLGLLATLWLTAGLAGLVFGNGWFSTDFSALVQAAVRLPGRAEDPATAWPSPLRRQLPGAVPFYGTLAFVLVVAGLAAQRGIRLASAVGLSLGGGRESAPTSRWASRGDLRSLRVRRSALGRLTLGRQGGSLLAAEALQSAVIVAPTQSGKTTGLAIPALLEWPGPIVATSIKTDLLRDTLARRRSLGDVMVYDPTASTGIPSVSATPLEGCQEWRGARRVANWLCSSAREGAAAFEGADFWYAAAEKLLAPLLYAAAANEQQMADVVRWLDAGERAQPAVSEFLKATRNPDARMAWQATLNRDERQRASIYTTAETVLAAFADPRVLESSTRAEYSAKRLLDGSSSSLYLCAPAHEQKRLRPIFSMMIREVLAETYERSASLGGPIDPPLLLVLDEAANIAPIPNLDEVASSGAGQGIQLLTVFQDLAQVRARYGDDRAETVINNHRAKVFGSGISDARTLDYIGRVIGAGEFQDVSRTAGERPGRQSTTQSTSLRDLAPGSVVREAREGTALLLYGRLPPARIDLRPWFRDRRLRALAAAARGEADHA